MNQNLAANAVATANLQDASVTDSKIVSVNSSKVFGTVASATNAATLTNGNWNVSVGTFNSYANSFIIEYTNGLLSFA